MICRRFHFTCSIACLAFTPHMFVWKNCLWLSAFHPWIIYVHLCDVICLVDLEFQTLTYPPVTVPWSYIPLSLTHQLLQPFNCTSNIVLHIIIISKAKEISIQLKMGNSDYYLNMQNECNIGYSCFCLIVLNCLQSRYFEWLLKKNQNWNHVINI